MKKKMGFALSCLPVGVLFVLVEYYYHLLSIPLLILCLISLPIISLFLITGEIQQPIRHFIIPTAILSALIGTILFYLIGAPPNSWLKPLNPFGLACTFAIVGLIFQLIGLMGIDMFKKEDKKLL